MCEPRPPKLEHGSSLNQTWLPFAQAFKRATNLDAVVIVPRKQNTQCQAQMKNTLISDQNRTKPPP